MLRAAICQTLFRQKRFQEKIRQTLTTSNFPDIQYIIMGLTITASSYT